MMVSGSAFPFRRIASRDELEVLKLSTKLAKVLHMLSDEVYRVWSLNRNDAALQRVAGDLVSAGASLLTEPMLVGRIVVERAEPYWMRRALLDETGVTVVKEIGSDALNMLLAEAIRWDEEIRLKVTELRTNC